MSLSLGDSFMSVGIRFPIITSAEAISPGLTPAPAKSAQNLKLQPFPASSILFLCSSLNGPTTSTLVIFPVLLYIHYYLSLSKRFFPLYPMAIK